MKLRKVELKKLGFLTPKNERVNTENDKSPKEDSRLNGPGP